MDHNLKCLTEKWESFNGIYVFKSLVKALYEKKIIHQGKIVHLHCCCSHNHDMNLEVQKEPRDHLLHLFIRPFSPFHLQQLSNFSILFLTKILRRVIDRCHLLLSPLTLFIPTPISTLTMTHRKKAPRRPPMTSTFQNPIAYCNSHLS